MLGSFSTKYSWEEAEAHLLVIINLWPDHQPPSRPSSKAETSGTQPNLDKTAQQNHELNSPSQLLNCGMA